MVVLFFPYELRSEPNDKYSITHSTFIRNTQTWSNVALSSMTVRQGDKLAFIVCSSTAVGSNVTVYDGLDSGGAVRAFVQCHEAGRYDFEVALTSSTNRVTINKTGAANVGLTFYVTHPVKEE